MAPTYIAGFVVLLAQLLPLVGIDVELDALNVTVQTVATIAAGLVIIYRQLTTGRSTLLGFKP